MAYTLYITPTSFIASSGKLTSARRYIRKVASGPDLKFVVAPNMHVKNGGLRYVNPSGSNTDDGSYNGSFTTSASVGIKTK